MIYATFTFQTWELWLNALDYNVLIHINPLVYWRKNLALYGTRYEHCTSLSVMHVCIHIPFLILLFFFPGFSILVWNPSLYYAMYNYKAVIQSHICWCLTASLLKTSTLCVALLWPQMFLVSRYGKCAMLELLLGPVAHNLYGLEVISSPIRLLLHLRYAISLANMLLSLL